MAEYTVTLQPTNEIFTVKSNELILEAAIRHNVFIPYSCRNGTCRTCIFHVKEGSVQQLDAELCAITSEELEANRRLVCLSICTTDTILEKLSPRKNKKAESLQT